MNYSFTRALGQNRLPLTVEQTLAQRIDRFICARCGNCRGDCGHNCRSLSVMG